MFVRLLLHKCEKLAIFIYCLAADWTKNIDNNAAKSNTLFYVLHPSPISDMKIYTLHYCVSVLFQNL